MVVEPTSTARAANKEGGTARCEWGTACAGHDCRTHKGILTDPSAPPWTSSSHYARSNDRIQYS